MPPMVATFAILEQCVFVAYQYFRFNDYLQNLLMFVCP